MIKVNKGPRKRYQCFKCQWRGHKNDECHFTIEGIKKIIRP